MNTARTVTDVLAKKLREYGFSCVDYNMANTDSLIYTSSEEDMQKLLLNEKRLASEAGIEFSQVHGPWRWPPKDDTKEDREERMEKMKKSIRMTSVLGCKNWVIHPLLPFGSRDADTENAQKTWDINIEFMSELLKTAKEYDVTICFENMPFLEFSLSKPEEVLRFVKTVDDDNFKICLDTGHVSVFEDLSLGDEVRKLGDEIRVLHVHDNKWSMDLHLIPYFGIIDWSDFAKALKDIGYKGVFSLETVPSPKLPEPIFEEMSITLLKIAKEIIKDI